MDPGFRRDDRGEEKAASNHTRFIDRLGEPVNDRAMDMDEFLPKKSDDPLIALTRQDLDPFSVEELRARITVLEAEIARAKARIDRAVNHRANAEGLFKR